MQSRYISVAIDFCENHRWFDRFASVGRSLQRLGYSRAEVNRLLADQKEEFRRDKIPKGMREQRWPYPCKEWCARCEEAYHARKAGRFRQTVQAFSDLYSERGWLEFQTVTLPPYAPKPNHVSDVVRDTPETENHYQWWLNRWFKKRVKAARESLKRCIERWRDVGIRKCQNPFMSDQNGEELTEIVNKVYDRDGACVSRELPIPTERVFRQYDDHPVRFSRHAARMLPKEFLSQKELQGVYARVTNQAKSEAKHEVAFDRGLSSLEELFECTPPEQRERMHELLEEIALEVLREEKSSGAFSERINEWFSRAESMLEVKLEHEIGLVRPRQDTEVEFEESPEFREGESAFHGTASFPATLSAGRLSRELSGNNEQAWVSADRLVNDTEDLQDVTELVHYARLQAMDDALNEAEELSIADVQLATLDFGAIRELSETSKRFKLSPEVQDEVDNAWLLYCWHQGWMQACVQSRRVYIPMLREIETTLDGEPVCRQVYGPSIEPYLHPKVAGVESLPEGCPTFRMPRSVLTDMLKRYRNRLRKQGIKFRYIQVHESGERKADGTEGDHEHVHCIIGFHEFRIPEGASPAEVARVIGHRKRRRFRMAQAWHAVSGNIIWKSGSWSEPVKKPADAGRYLAKYMSKSMRGRSTWVSHRLGLGRYNQERRLVDLGLLPEREPVVSELAAGGFRFGVVNDDNEHKHTFSDEELDAAGATEWVGLTRIKRARIRNQYIPKHMRVDAVVRSTKCPSLGKAAGAVCIARDRGEVEIIPRCDVWLPAHVFMSLYQGMRSPFAAARGLFKELQVAIGAMGKEESDFHKHRHDQGYAVAYQAQQVFGQKSFKRLRVDYEMLYEQLSAVLPLPRGPTSRAIPVGTDR